MSDDDVCQFLRGDLSTEKITALSNAELVVLCGYFDIHSPSSLNKTQMISIITEKIAEGLSDSIQVEGAGADENIPNAKVSRPCLTQHMLIHPPMTTFGRKQVKLILL